MIKDQSKIYLFKKIKIDESFKKQRADKLIAEKSNLTRSFIEKSIKKNLIFIDKQILKNASKKINSGNEILIYKEIENKIENNKKLNIIFENQDFILVNKPAGITVHPDNNYKNDSLVHRLMHYTKGNLSNIGDENRRGVIHRLDINTSGILIFAKNNNAHLDFLEIFKTRKITKIYQTLVHGTLPKNGIIQSPIIRDHKNRKKMIVSNNKNAKYAITHFKNIKNFNDNRLSLVEVKLETGRTHQIRVHFSSIGFPLVGDNLYGNIKLDEQLENKIKYKIPRIFLHSQKLQFNYKNKKYNFNCNLSEDLEILKNKINSN